MKEVVYFKREEKGNQNIKERRKKNESKKPILTLYVLFYKRI